MFKKAVQRDRSERRGDAYSLQYVEPRSDARTKLADFFNILLGAIARRREVSTWELNATSLWFCF
jgi:hypothetical protein